MGSYQSKPTRAERAVITRLRALELETKHEPNDDGFVEVDGLETEDAACLNEKALGALRRAPTTLNVGQLEHWQSKLLEDPKNRSVLSSPYATAPTLLF